MGNLDTGFLKYLAAKYISRSRDGCLRYRTGGLHELSFSAAHGHPSSNAAATLAAIISNAQTGHSGDLSLLTAEIRMTLINAASRVRDLPSVELLAQTLALPDR